MEKGRRLRLLASIHDVSPRTEAETDRLYELLSSRIGEAKLAMLVVPDHWGQALIRPGSAFARRLRRWSDAGVEIFAHGWFHRDDAPSPGVVDRWRARHLTAGEGEFLGLGEAEAARRMVAGKALIEDVIGRPVAGFVAPAWLYGAGARRALGYSGFALAEDHLRVWQPASGRVLSRGPVISWASRSSARAAASRGFAMVARHCLAHLPVVRLAVHPGDLSRPELVGSIERTLTSLLRYGRPGRYADLITPYNSPLPQEGRTI